MKKIAIIGSGFFGVSAGLLLSKKNQIHIFEKENSILCGASRANQMRFHMGYHYPRSIKTSKEILKHYKDFINFYGSNIFGNTKNYYAISKKNSKTSFSDYIKFLKKCDLSYKNQGSEFFSKNLSGSIEANEKIINYFKFKKLISQKIKKNKNIKVFLKSNFKKELISNYDKIIISTYDQNNNVLKNLGLKPKKKFKYELIEKIIIKLPKKYCNKSFMVLDGKFVCLDPYLGTKYHLLSDNQNSKIEVIRDIFPNFKNSAKTLVNKMPQKINTKTRFNKFISKGKKFLPFLTDAKYIGSFFITRVIEIGKEKTDERTSKITKINNKVFTVFSGKWNTSVGISKILVKILDD